MRIAFNEISSSIRMKSILVSAAAVSLAGNAALGGVVEVESFHLGGFYDLDASGGALIPDNDMSFQNYFMGHTTVGGFKTTERRTFFAFDLAGIDVPDGEIVTGVEFVLTLPFAGIIANFADGVEEVVFTSTTTAYSAFADPPSSGLFLDEIFESMGTGDLYGGIGFDTETPDGEFSIDMSDAALTDMETSMADGSPFVITGMLDTYDPDPAAVYEFVFGLTDVVTGGGPTGFPVPKLIITTAPVPAPATIGMIALGGIAFNRRKR